MSPHKNRNRLRITALIIGSIMATMTGCAPPPTGAAWFNQAREDFLHFSTAIAGVQNQLWENDWDVGDYGDIPWSCATDNSYRFSSHWLLPKKLSLELPEGGVLQAGQELATWMAENGWTNVEIIDHQPEFETVVVVADYPAMNVAKIIIDINSYNNDGEHENRVGISGDSYCKTGGDDDELLRMMYPDWDERLTLLEDSPYKAPEFQSPTETPIFGFHLDGTPRPANITYTENN